jgi:hypothetical protein
MAWEVTSLKRFGFNMMDCRVKPAMTSEVAV